MTSDILIMTSDMLIMTSDMLIMTSDILIMTSDTLIMTSDINNGNKWKLHIEMVKYHFFQKVLANLSNSMHFSY